MAIKRCPMCSVEKPLDAFSKCITRYDGKQPYCKPCFRVYKREWRAKNPEKATRMYRRQNLRFCFGLSLDDYDTMLLAQSGLCAICKRPEIIPHSSLSVDHNHMTKTNRELLCRGCNSVMGYLEGPYGQSAMAYLARWSGK